MYFIVKKIDGFRLKKSTHDERGERGAALALSVIVLAVLSVVALTALAFSSTEARIAGADLQRSQTFYAGTASIEKMTSDFSDIFRKKMTPSSADLTQVASNVPAGLVNEGFTFTQSIFEDVDRANELRAVQGLPADEYPRVNVPSGPFSGLNATLIPYKISSTTVQDWSGAKVELEREFNNYLVPLFQFGVYSAEDIEIHPGPLMTFNGRIHGNRNIYALRNVKFLNRVTAAGEFVRDAYRDGSANLSNGNNNVWMEVNGINVQSTIGNGSVKAGAGVPGGPNIPGATAGQRGFYPDSPDGAINTSWDANSILSVNGTPNRFGGQLLTHSTGATYLSTPLELSGFSTSELIKRSLSNDSQILKDSRYHSKAQIRILIDDENEGSGATNLAGIPAGKGVKLSEFSPSPLGGGNVLRRVSTTGTYLDGSTIKQKLPDSSLVDARTVRGVKSTAETVGSNYIPPGAGLTGKVLVEIVKPDGTAIDVTQEILSMGVTVGEPNGIVYLQRGLWAAYVPGSRHSTGSGLNLVNLIRNTQNIADGEITQNPSMGTRGSLDIPVSSTINTSVESRDPGPLGGYRTYVPINIYNVREGWYRSQLDENKIYERGITSVIDLNMRNLAKWLDGIYDTNLLAGTNAVSANIEGEEGYVVYVSDRRGDTVKAEYLPDGTTYQSTNGIVDNEDIYGPNGTLDDGEDVIDFGWGPGGVAKKGTLQNDTTELPTTGAVFDLATYGGDRVDRSNVVNQVQNNYFRRAVRLFDGETMSFSAATGKLSPKKGITVASENMVYIWGNYNTTGVNNIPAGGSTLNSGGYNGPQIPASIVADAVFPLSKTWFDALPALYPEGTSDARNRAGTPYRMADENLTSITQGTSVRAGLIAGNTISAANGSPGRDIGGLRRNGGFINFPRFLEQWAFNGVKNSWNYSGSLISIFRSTQAMSQWENDSSVIYMPPKRNWSFDNTYLSPHKLPPGTPFFQYVQATAFRQKMR